MTTTWLILVPVLVLPVVLLLAFTGCAGILGIDDVHYASPPPTPQGPQTYDQLILATQGLVAYWPLTDTGPTDAQELFQHPPYEGGYQNIGGQANLALKFHQVGPIPKDPNNFAVEFDGAHGLVQISTFHPDLNPSSFTVEAWVKPAGTVPAGTQQAIVSSHDYVAGNQERGFDLYVVRPAKANANLTNPVFRARVHGTNAAGTATGTAAATWSLNELGAQPQNDDGLTNTWWYLVATYDSPSNALNLYVNPGKLPQHAATNQSNFTFVPNTDQNVMVRIAADRGRPSVNATNFFNGLIARVAVYRDSSALDLAAMGKRYDWINP